MADVRDPDNIAGTSKETVGEVDGTSEGPLQNAVGLTTQNTPPATPSTELGSTEARAVRAAASTSNGVGESSSSSKSLESFARGSR